MYSKNRLGQQNESPVVKFSLVCSVYCVPQQLNFTAGDSF